MKKLEGYKAFSYIAWATVVAFSLFTYSLVLQLQESVEHLTIISSEWIYTQNDVVDE